MRLLILLIILTLSSPAALCDIPRPDNAVAEAAGRLRSLPLHPVEGLWQFPGHDAVIEICRDDTSSVSDNVARYNMTLILTSDLSVRPGTVVGYLTPTGRYGVYDSRIYTEMSSDGERRLVNPRKYVLTLEDGESRLVMKRYGKKMKFRWWRLMPYMFRWAISDSEISPGELEGLVRIFPEPAIPLNPVYL